MKRLFSLLIFSLFAFTALAQKEDGGGGGSAERLGLAAGPGGVALETRGTDVIQDGSFETGTPNSFWNEASSNFGTPICDVGGCGTGTGTGPHTGSFWVWFGGVNATEVGSVDQDVTLTNPGTATLSFFLEIPVADNAGTFDVDVNGNTVFSATDATAGFTTYAPVSIDVTGEVNNGSNNVAFNSTTQPGTNVTNFFLDDVALDIAEASVPTLSQWGLMAMVLVLMAVALVFMRRQQTA